MEQFEGQLTPEEAKAVIDLHHLRESQREEDKGYVLVDELREILGVTPEEIASLVSNVRAVLPSRAAVSRDRITRQEAELIVARNARQTTTPVELGQIDAQVVADVRSRNRELASLEQKAHPAGPPLDFQVAVGEHPHSWAIMWAILGGILLLITLLVIFFRQ